MLSTGSKSPGLGERSPQSPAVAAPLPKGSPAKGTTVTLSNEVRSTSRTSQRDVLSHLVHYLSVQWGPSNPVGPGDWPSFTETHVLPTPSPPHGVGAGVGEG